MKRVIHHSQGKLNGPGHEWFFFILKSRSNRKCYILTYQSITIYKSVPGSLKLPFVNQHLNHKVNDSAVALFTANKVKSVCFENRNKSCWTHCGFNTSVIEKCSLWERSRNTIQFDHKSCNIVWLDANRCSNRKLRGTEGASESGSWEVCRLSLCLGPWPRQKCPANTICFVISQLHFHDPATRFHFSTQNENVCECSHFPACSFYEDSELEHIVLLNHNRQ